MSFCQYASLVFLTHYFSNQFSSFCFSVLKVKTNIDIIICIVAVCTCHLSNQFIKHSSLFFKLNS